MHVITSLTISMKFVSICGFYQNTSKLSSLYHHIYQRKTALIKRKIKNKGKYIDKITLDRTYLLQYIWIFKKY